MNTSYSQAWTEYMAAWTALRGKSAWWLLSDDGDRAFQRYTQALVDLGCVLDEEQAA